MKHGLHVWVGGIVLAAFSLSAQNPPVAADRERGMWNTEFREQRATATAATASPAAAPKQQRASLMLGITAWRLRESKSGDRSRMLVHEGAQAAPVEWTPERLAADQQLSEGDRVRITVEAAAAGFLYVVSREVYQGGKFGDPYLIFPSTRIRGGRGNVAVGEVVDIPEWNNPTPYLTIRKGRPDEIGEQVIVLLAPKEIGGLRVAGGAMKLDPALLESWVRQWGGNVKTLDAPDQRGTALSPAEHTASSQGARLGPKDPVPQVLFRAAGQESLLAFYTLRLRP